MNKRKIVMLALAVMMIAILAIGGTLAYFTAESGADNVFVMGGDVNIEIEENFDPESPLYPGLDVTKEVFINNTGSGKAYARVHIAIPAEMDSGDPHFDASRNFLHFNFSMDSVADGLWSWKSENSDGIGYDVADWNYYDGLVADGVEYNVYVVTYRTALNPGEQTKYPAIFKVYLDPTVECEAVVVTDAEGNPVKNADGTYKVEKYVFTDDHGNTVELTPEEAKDVRIKVWAEATQEETFTNAYEALNTVFGEPGTYNPWN